MKLLDLIDTNMELFDKDPGYSFTWMVRPSCWTTIGNRPEKRAVKTCQRGTFPPFYILQDEFLTSGEANVRNLQTGILKQKPTAI